MKQLQRVFRVLGNSRRLAIVHLLIDRRELSVGTVAGFLKLSITATSKHLNALAGADLLEKRQESTTVYYRINADAASEAKLILQTIIKLK